MRTIRQYVQFRYLLSELVKKEIKLRYKRSVLGLLWSLLQPILMMAVFTVVFTFIPKLANLNVPFYAFFLTGYLPWIFFATAVSNSHTSIIANSALVKQVYFPRQLLPLASCLSNLVHFLLALGLWILYVLIVFGYPGPQILLLPVAVGIQLLFIAGIALILSSMNVFFRDVGQILEVFLTFLFYLTPVFYTYSILDEYLPAKYRFIAQLLEYNPLAQFVMLYRALLLKGFEIRPFMILYPLGFSIVLLAVGHLYFKRTSATFAKEL